MSVFLIAALEIASIAAPGKAVATSCKGPGSLADRYAASDAIVVGQPLACANKATPARGFPVPGACPDLLYDVEILEVLKDSVPPRDHSGTFEASGFMGCGPEFRVGETYLLFLDDSGQPMHGGSSHLSGDGWTVERETLNLGILRQFRDGEIDDLSGPWRFTDTGLTCNVQHDFDEARLGFDFAYSPQADNFLVTEEEQGPNGEVIYTAVHPFSELAAQLGHVAPEFNGPEPEDHTLVLTFSYNERQGADDQRVVITVDEKTWPLYLRVDRLEGRLFPEPEIYVSYYTVGAAATEILDAMTTPSEIRVTLIETPVQGETIGPYIELRSRSTQLRATRNRFDACVNGDERRGAIIN